MQLLIDSQNDDFDITNDSKAYNLNIPLVKKITTEVNKNNKIYKSERIKT